MGKAILKEVLLMRNQRTLGVLDLILGVLLFFAGLHAVTHPWSALAGVTLFYGLLAILTGIVDVIFYVKLERRTGFGPAAALVTGILSILTGILVLAQPAVGSVSLAILFPVWFIAHCISGLTRLPLIRWTAGNGYYYFALAVNVIGLMIGLMMLCSPLLSMLSLPWMAGICLLLLGISSIVFGIQKLISRR